MLFQSSGNGGGVGFFLTSLKVVFVYRKQFLHLLEF